MKTYKLSLILLLTASALVAAAAGAQTRTAARQSSGVCRVSAPSRGADLGALINACDQRLGSGGGTISVSGGGNIATRVVVSPRHTLLFAGGVYTASTPGTVMWLKDSTALRCESQAALQESTAPNVNAG